MVVHRKDMKKETKVNMRGGEKSAVLTHCVDCENEKNIRLLSEISLEPGASIGYHSHENETEYFLIISGSGVVNDDGKEIEVKTGDSVITGNGAYHSIKNTGAVPLVMHAVIVTH